ncbi:hypothetical protein D3C81_1893030 [compost metagenome]
MCCASGLHGSIHLYLAGFAHLTEHTPVYWRDVLESALAADEGSSDVMAEQGMGHNDLLPSCFPPSLERPDIIE